MASFLRPTATIAARQACLARLPARSSSPLLTLMKRQQLSTSVVARASKASKAPKPIDITTAPHSHSTIDSKDPFGSSPVFTRSHPFLRKYQASSRNGSATLNSSPGSPAFSTTAVLQNASNSKDSTASAPPSPTAAAANATEALFEKRLQESKHKKHQEQHSNELSCSCGASQTSASEYGLYYGSDDETQIDLPPISDEARRFTQQLLGQNKAWAERMDRERPGFFAKLEKQQTPQVLWIGCSDSRVPANQIVNLDPGEVFVHRNIANVVTHTDMNLLSVLEYAVDVLKVRHVIVCGHYGCGGVAASLTQKNFGVIDNWLRNIKDLYTIHRKKFDKLPAGSKEQQDLLTELNVIQSALNVCHTSTIQKAWARGAELSIHAWCYRLSDGMIRDLGLCIEGPGATEDVYHVEKQ